MLPAQWPAMLWVQAGAAATVTGLVFVAASIHLSRIIAIPNMPNRVAETIFQFLQVFFICTAALIPRQPVPALAIEILAVALLSGGFKSPGTSVMRGRAPAIPEDG